MKKKYLVQFIQEVILFEKEVEAESEKEAEETAYQYLHKIDRDIYHKTDIQEIEEEEEPPKKEGTMKIYTDGSGNGKIAFIIQHGSQGITKTEDIGDCTNNVAEYTAVLKALEYVTSNLTVGERNIEIISDSELIVKQLKHEYHIKNDTLREKAKATWDIIQKNQLNVTFTWVRRKENLAGKLLG
jgi:ribonuclease HI